MITESNSWVPKGSPLKKKAMRLRALSKHYQLPELDYSWNTGMTSSPEHYLKNKTEAVRNSYR